MVQIWLFNITNVDSIRQGKKPKLDQVGPYTYRKFKIKVTSWWDHQGRVATKEYDYFIFQPDLTPADLNATIVTLNMPLIGVVESIHAAFGPLYRRLLDLIVSVIAGWKDGHVNGLFTTRSAEELIWGYQDLLLQRLSGMLPHGMIKSTRVGFMDNMTGPEDALVRLPVVFDTGRYNLSNIWNVESFEGLTEVRCWNNCSLPVRGSDGNQFHPGISRDERLPVWVAPLFRSEDFIYREDVSWGGIDFLRFGPDPAGLAPNDCLFQTLPGLMNITTPKAVGINGTAGTSTGPPLYVSQPHFCLCDPSLTEGVEGLTCDMALHSTYLDIEPITGIPMRGHLTSMVSSEITLAARQHLEPQIAKNNNQSIITPIFWQEENIHATDQDLANFRGKVYRALWYQRAVKGWMLPCGVGLLLLSVVLAVVQRGRQEMPREAADEEAEEAERGTHAPDGGAGTQEGGSDGQAGLVQPLLQPRGS